MSDPGLEFLAEEARGPAGRGARRPPSRPLTRACVAVLVAIGVVAALAPLISMDRPLVLETGEGRRFPLFAALGRDEVFALWLLAGALAALVVRRFARRGSRAALLIVAAAGAVHALGHEPAFETRRYAREIPVRRELAELDAGATSADAARARLLDLEARMPLLADLAAAIDARVTRIDALAPGTRPRDDAGFAALVATNARELAALEDAIFPPLRFDPADPTFGRLLPPGGGHPLGTDGSGRDLLARLIHGAKTSLGIALAAATLAAAIAAVLGGVAGYFGGRVDWVVSRLIETTMCLPALFLLVVLAAYVPPAPGGRAAFLVAIVAALTWTHPARLFRAEVMRIRAADFVVAARALGASHARVIVRHVLPNAATPLLVAATFTVGGVVLLEAALSFLGLGLHDAPSWGQALRDARQTSRLDRTWHLAVFPGLALFATVFSLNWLGDAWRDAADPRSR